MPQKDGVVAMGMILDKTMSAMRKAIESMYEDTCDVIEHQKVKDPVTKKTGFSDVPVLLAQPCRISYKTIPATGDGNTASVTQEIKLFISPDVEIKAGSKIEVTHKGKTTPYSRSSKSAEYETHQEITLVLFDRWA